MTCSATVATGVNFRLVSVRRKLWRCSREGLTCINKAFPNTHVLSNDAITYTVLSRWPNRNWRSVLCIIHYRYYVLWPMHLSDAHEVRGRSEDEVRSRNEVIIIGAASSYFLKRVLLQRTLRLKHLL